MTAVVQMMVVVCGTKRREQPCHTRDANGKPIERWEDRVERRFNVYYDEYSMGEVPGDWRPPVITIVNSDKDFELADELNPVRIFAVEVDVGWFASTFGHHCPYVHEMLANYDNFYDEALAARLRD